MSDVPPPPVFSRLSDPDMQAAPVALMRAAMRAREIAARTGTKLIVVEDGKLLELTVTLPPAQVSPSPGPHAADKPGGPADPAQPLAPGDGTAS